MPGYLQRQIHKVNIRSLINNPESTELRSQELNNYQLILQHMHTNVIFKLIEK